MATLPSTLKLRGREGKYIFKKALEPLLPHDILYRQKMGFAGLSDAQIFDRRQLERLVDQHLSGRRNFAPSIWALLMFAQSYERLFGQREVPAQAATGA